MSDDKSFVIACGAPIPSAEPNDGVLPFVCPWCGAETEFGFGLAGGGYGPYVMCSAEHCDFFKKRQEEDA